MALLALLVVPSIIALALHDSTYLLVAYVITCNIRSFLFTLVIYSSVALQVVPSSFRVAWDVMLFSALCCYAFWIPIGFFALPLWTKYFCLSLVTFTIAIVSFVSGAWIISALSRRIQPADSIVDSDNSCCIHLLAVMFKLWGGALIAISTRTFSMFELSEAQLVATTLLHVFFAVVVIVLPGRSARRQSRAAKEMLRLKQIIVRYASHEIR